jgi:hypothetical protein
MPHWDRRLNPDLVISPPGDLPPGSTVTEVDDPWEARFGDGEWRNVKVRSWLLDRHGRHVTQVEWRAGGSTYNGTFLFDETRMRENPRAPASWRPPPRQGGGGGALLFVPGNHLRVISAGKAGGLSPVSATMTRWTMNDNRRHRSRRHCPP